MDPLTHRAAGVDIQAGDLAVRRIAPLAASTRRPEVLGGIGGVRRLLPRPGRLSRAGARRLHRRRRHQAQDRRPAGRHDTVGIDLVAMCVNDCSARGAEPLFFLDYIATGTLDARRDRAIVAGIAEGCRQAGCALLGGETAEMPGFYAPGDYDLAGFCVGVVEQSRIIDGSRRRGRRRGASAWPRSGLHSNGYTLARKAIFGRMGLKLDDPSRSWAARSATSCSSPPASTSRPVLRLLPPRSTVQRRWPTSPAAASPRTCRACCPPAAAPASRCPRGRCRPSSRASSARPRSTTRRCGARSTWAWASCWSSRPTTWPPRPARLETAGERVLEVGEIVAGDPGSSYV